MGTYVANVQAKRLTATGTVFAGPARLLGIYFVADTTAGSIELKDGGAGGTSKAVFDTPLGASTAGQETTYQIEIPGDGIRFETDLHATLSNVDKVTFLFG
jgi:hypothetical protein